MNTLLVNGCSFGQCWSPSDSFLKKFGCTSTVNLSKGGTSFQRTCRSTIEWIAQNHKPTMVAIPITFAHRWELALNLHEDPIDGSWVPLQNSNFLSDKYTLQETSVESVKELVEQYYKVIPTIKTHWDKIFTEIIMFAAFLEKQKIPYLMWDMCNGFDKEHIEGYAGFVKVELIEQNPYIIDLWRFCGNRFMRDTMTEDAKAKTPEFAHHHAQEQYYELEKYIIQYYEKNLQ